MKFIQLLAIMSLPSAAIAAPDSVPATDNDDPAVVDDPAMAPVTKTLSPVPLKRPPPMTVAPAESFKLTLSEDKKVIHLMGSFRSGISAALKTMLIKNPSVETVVLSSPGGSMIDGFAVEKIIRQHGVNTHVELMCASACSEAFQGGKQRTVAPTGRLGFHQSTQSGFLSALMAIDERESAANQLIRDIWKRRGLSDAFVEQTLNTPGRDIWLPTNAELLAENIVTKFTEGGDPGIAPVGRWNSAAAMESDVLTGPVWTFARANRPKLYLRSAMVFWIGDIVAKDAVPPQKLAETTLIAALLKNADSFSDDLLLRFIAAESAGWESKADVVNKSCRGTFRSNFPIFSGEPSSERQALVLEMMQAVDGEMLIDPKRHKAAQASVIEYWADMLVLGEFDSDNVSRNFCTEPVNYYNVLMQLPEAKRLEYFRALAVTLLHPAPSPVKLNLP